MKLFKIFIPIFCLFNTLFASYEVLDANGLKHSFNQPPERVACVTPSVTELIFAINKGEKLVANSPYCRFPEKAREKVKIGAYLDPDFEKIAQIKPDLFIINTSKNDIFTKRLEKLNIPTLSLYGDGLANISKNIAILGEVFQDEERAKALILEIDEEIERAKLKGAKLKSRKAILMFGKMSAGKGSYAGELLEATGAKNIMANSKSPWIAPDREFILVSKPEIIILEAKSAEDFKKQVSFYKSDPIWARTPAVKNNKIYPIDSDLISIPCSHIIGAVRRLSEIMQEAQGK